MVGDRRHDPVGHLYTRNDSYAYAIVYGFTPNGSARSRDHSQMYLKFVNNSINRSSNYIMFQFGLGTIKSSSGSAFVHFVFERKSTQVMKLLFRDNSNMKGRIKLGKIATIFL